MSPQAPSSQSLLLLAAALLVLFGLVIGCLEFWRRCVCPKLPSVGTSALLGRRWRTLAPRRPAGGGGGGGGGGASGRWRWRSRGKEPEAALIKGRWLAQCWPWRWPSMVAKEGARCWRWCWRAPLVAKEEARRRAQKMHSEEEALKHSQQALRRSEQALNAAYHTARSLRGSPMVAALSPQKMAVGGKSLRSVPRSSPKTAGVSPYKSNPRVRHICL